jgi:hypothetical protein
LRRATDDVLRLLDARLRGHDNHCGGMIAIR